MLRSHNGVHCCGTVGDSHSHSQLSTAKCTFTGDSFQNHNARTVQPVLAISWQRYEKICKEQKKKQFFCLARTIFPPYWLNGALLPAVASTLPCCRLDSREQSGSQQGSCQRQYSWSNRKYSKSIRNFFRSIVFVTPIARDSFKYRESGGVSVVITLTPSLHPTLHPRPNPMFQA